MKHTLWRIEKRFLPETEYSVESFDFRIVDSTGSVVCNHLSEANAHLIAAAPEQHEALYFLGGGDVYLEAFGRLCFCHGCSIGEKGAIDKKIHSSACDSAWKAYSKAEGGK
jgi:hypothetical protein